MKRSLHKGLSLLLSFAMLLSMMGTTALAAEATPHVHNEECGYVEAVDGVPCTHQHNEECGFMEVAEEVPCDMDCTDTNGDGLTDHAEGCAYIPAAEGASCNHQHDEACGYVEAVEGKPCTFTAEEAPEEKTAHAKTEGCTLTDGHEGDCVVSDTNQRVMSVAAMIAALPEYSATTSDDVAAIEAAQAAYDALTGEEKTAVDESLVIKLTDLAELAKNLKVRQPSKAAALYTGSILDFTAESAPASGQGWVWASETRTLTLSGANLETAIKLPGNSIIVLADGSENSIITSDAEAVYCTGSLEITGENEGTGKLTANYSNIGAAKNGIYVYSASGDASLKIENCEVAATGRSGICVHSAASGNVTMDIVNASVAASTTEKQSGNFPQSAINTIAMGGSAVLTISNSEVTAAGNYYGLQSNASTSAKIEIVGSDVNALAAASDAIHAEANSATEIAVSGSTVSCNGNSSGIFSQIKTGGSGTAKLSVTGGTMEAEGGDYGLLASGAADTTLELSGNGDVKAIGRRQAGLCAKSTTDTASLQISETVNKVEVGNAGQTTQIVPGMTCEGKNGNVSVNQNGTLVITPGEAGELTTKVTKVGYAFVGWYDNEGLNGDAVTTATAGSTYYAKWLEMSGTCGDPTVNDGKNVTWALTSNDTGLTLTISGTGKMADFEWDSAASAINAGWGSSRKEITKVIVEDGVTDVGALSFRSFTNLSELTLSDSVTEIGNNAFYYSSSGSANGLTLTSVPSNLQKIGSSAFNNAHLSGVLVLPATVTEIGQQAFTSNKLTTIRIRSANVSIGDYAFGSSSSLVALDLTEVSSLTVGQFITQADKNAVIYVSSGSIADSFTSLGSSHVMAVAVSNGGTFADDSVFEAGKLSTPEKEGYIFGGWYDNADFIGDAVTAPVAGTSYYARWISNGPVSVSTEAELREAIKYASSDVEKPTVIKTLNNIELTSTLTIPTGKVIELQGEGHHLFRSESLTATKATSLITIDGTLTTRNVTLDACCNENINGFRVVDVRGILTIYDTVIQNGYLIDGGGANVLISSANGMFSMYSGKIQNGHGKNSGGVFVYGGGNGGTFNMYGGEISNNVGTWYGSAVVIYSDSAKAYLYDGKIFNNKVERISDNIEKCDPMYGGAIFVNGSESAYIYGDLEMYGNTATFISSQGDDKKSSDIDIWCSRSVSVKSTPNVMSALKYPLKITFVIDHSSGNPVVSGNESYALSDEDLKKIQISSLDTDVSSYVLYLDKENNKMMFTGAKTITFNANDGSAAEPTVQKVPASISTALTTNQFTRPGYAFTGWNTAANGVSGTAYADEAAVTLSADTTLYAQWRELAITLADKTGDNALTYDGTAQALTAALEDDEDAAFAYTYALRTSTDGEGTYAEATATAPTDAGYYKVTALLKDSDRVAVTAYMEIKPAALTVSAIKEAAKTFDGSNTFPNAGLVLSGVAETDTITATATAKVSGAGAGDYSSATLSDILLPGEKKDNYTLTIPTGAVNTENEKSLTIEKAVLGMSLSAQAASGTVVGDQVTLTAALTGMVEGFAPTGTVTFKDGNTVLAQNVDITSGTASFVWTSTSGTHDFTAEYIPAVSGENYTANTALLSGYDVAKKNQTGISFDGITGNALAKTKGEPAFTLTVTGGESSIAPRFESSNPAVATVEANGKVTILSAGTTTITARKGNTEYNEVTAALVLAVKAPAAAITPEDAPDGTTIVAKEATPEQIAALNAQINGMCANYFAGMTTFMADIQLLNISDGSNAPGGATFLIAYPAGITGENYIKYSFTVLHLKGGATPELITPVATTDGLRITVSDFSPFAIGYKANSQYTVTFDSKGGSSVSTVTGVQPGEKIVAPTDPTRSGYTFTGWFTDAACTQAWSFETGTVNGDMTLYAGWKAIKPTPTPDPGKPTPTPGPSNPSTKPNPTTPPADSPQTGDTSTNLLWWLLAASSLLLGGTIIIFNKKRNVFKHLKK